MMMLGPFPFHLLLAIMACKGSASDSCGRFTYHRYPPYDGQHISDALEVKVTATRAECFSNCFHHRLCNRFLHNDQTGECHLHSTEGTPVSSAPGFKYYAADCTISKSLSPPTCPPQFAPFADSSVLCYDGDQWVDEDAGAYTCHQIEWLDTDDENYPLPAPITPGFQLDIKGTWTSGTFLECTIEDKHWQPLVEVLRVGNNGAYSENSSGPVYYSNPLPVSSGVPFDMKATFNSTHYQISVDGNQVGTFQLSNPLTLAATIYAENEDSLDRVSFTYQ